MSQQHSGIRRIGIRLLLTLQFISVVIVMIYAGICSQRDYRDHEELSERTGKVVRLTYISQAALVTATTRYTTHSLPIKKTTALRVSRLPLGIGTLMWIFGTVGFESIDQIMGKEAQSLQTDGIYSYSRNPQYTGWLLGLLGAGVLKRSSSALITTILYWPLLHMYLRFVEEPHLKRVFREEYQQYQDNVPRYITLAWWKR